MNYRVNMEVCPICQTQEIKPDWPLMMCKHGKVMAAVFEYEGPRIVDDLQSDHDELDPKITAALINTAYRDLVEVTYREISGSVLTCGFCQNARPLHQNRCNVCSQWEKASHSGMREYPAPSREDAHMIRLMLRSVFGYVPGVKWSRV